MLTKEKLRLWDQNYIEFEVGKGITVTEDDSEYQSSLLLAFLYHALPRRTFETVAKKLGLEIDELDKICKLADRDARHDTMK